MFSKARRLVDIIFKFFISSHLLWILILLWSSVLLGEAINLDPSRFSDALKKVQDNVLGVKKMQDYFDSLTFEHEPTDGANVVDKLSKQLKQRFSEKVEIANELRIAIEDAYRQSSITSQSAFSECCKTNPTKIDYRFRTEILANEVCFTRASKVDSDAKYLPKSILDTMKRISKEKPNTKWQYFGSQEGVYHNFPAVKFPSCLDYDHRVRPWYVQGIAPEGKDVVIILDKSGSMETKYGGKTLMYIAIDAASTVLDSLNSKDKVGIVAFSTATETPGSRLVSKCYDTELAQAVPVNIKHLKQYMKNLKPEGQTHYSPALRKAFELLKSSSAGNESLQRRKVILFLTDGVPTETIPQHILDVLKEEKESLKRATSKDAVIFAYGIGNNDYTLLKKIADDTEAEGTKGTFVAIEEEDIDQLRSVLSSFYNQFARTVEHRSYSLSVPYYDVLGLGVLVSVVVPCWSQGNVIGVAGTDVVFTDLISDVFYFSEGEFSYAFLIDRETGNTLIHPQMPTLQSANDDPVILHITALEQAWEFENVFKSMIRGEEGHRSFIAKRFFPVGSGIDVGVRELVVNSTYYWKAVEGTNLAVCVVLGGTETEAILKIDDYGDKSIVYHREIDLVKNKVGFTECSHFGNRGTSDRAVFKFSPQSFEKPFVYITMMETEDTVKSFKDYIRYGVTNPEPKFKNGIREMVIPGIKAEEIWDSENSIAKDYVSYFTYATSNGITLVKPGGILDKNFDPTKRLWFQNAVNNKGKLALTTPYLDALGSGFLVDVVHTLQEKNSGGQRSEHDDVIAVVDASFGMFQFDRLFTGTYPECLGSNYRCFIMDKNGFLIMHKHFVDFKTLTNVDELAKEISSIHITMLEKGIAEDLINRNILRRKQCKKYKEIALENFYEVYLNGTMKSTSCPSYQISYLDGTNAFLGIVDDSACPNKGTCTCPSSIYAASKSECVCPFNSKIAYDYCKNEFPGNNVPLCPVSPPLLTSFEPPVESKKDLVDCDKGNCIQANVEGCYRQKACSWCQYDREKKMTLKTPFCVDIETCYGGVKGNRLSSLYGKDNTTPNMDNKENSNLPVIVACVAVVVVVLILVLVAYLVRKKYFKNKNKQPEPENPHALSPTTPNVQQPVRQSEVDRPPMPEPGYYEIPDMSNARTNLGMPPPPYVDERPPNYNEQYTEPNNWA